MSPEPTHNHTPRGELQQAPGASDKDFDAVILAGGAGQRMGGVSKADVVVSGSRLLDIALRAVHGARTTIVVGEVQVPPGVILTRESPPGTGPAAGLLAGLTAVSQPAEWTLVLACDLPDAVAAVAELHAAREADVQAIDGISLLDASGLEQPLLACYRTAALRAAFADSGDPANRPLRAVISRLRTRAITPLQASAADMDTPTDLARWIADHPDPTGARPATSKDDPWQ